MIWDRENGVYRSKTNLMKPPCKSFLPGMFPAGGAVQARSLRGSILFNGTDEYLNIASFSSSSPDVRTYTFSFWVKFVSIANSAFPVVFSFGTNSTNFTEIYVSSTDRLTFSDRHNGGSSDVENNTTVFVDDQWYHICIAVDTDASDKVLFYADGVEEGNDGYTKVGDTEMFENGGQVSIGFTHVFSSDYISAKVADFIVVEGQQLAASDFGYDSGGTWSWKEYEGSFGAHGFRINPRNSSDIGTDQSGNGYNFTLINIDSSNFDGADLPPHIN